MNPRNLDTIKGIALVNVATCAWATNIILGRYLRGQIGPLTLTAARSIVAVMVFALILRTRPASERKAGSDLKLLSAMALAGVVLFAPTLYLGLRYTTAVNGTFINALGPLLTAGFAAWLIKEPFSGRQVLGAVLALAGVAALVSGGASATAGAPLFNPGDLLIVLAATFWALYSIAVRKVVSHRSTLSATALSMYIGLPFLIVAAAVETSITPVTWSAGLVGIIVYLGLVPAALGFLSWNSGIKYLGAGGAMVFYNTLPLYGTLFGFLFLGETLGPASLAGGALILAGGLVAALKKKVVPDSKPTSK